MKPTDNSPDQTGTGSQANILAGAHDFNIVRSTITNIGRDAHYTYNTYLPESKPKEITADDLLLQNPSAPDVFTGRSHLVEESVNLLCEANQVYIAILGTGGIGKTSVVLHIMEHSLITEKFAGRCYFIPCEILPDATNLTQGLVRAIGLQVPQRKGPLGVLLDYLKGCQQSLLILDNFDAPWNGEDQAKVRNFINMICSFKSTSVIVTMRGTDGPGKIKWHKLGGQLGLPPLELGPAKEAFCSFSSDGNYAIKEDDPILEKLLIQMDGMPLAIMLIAQHARELPLQDLMEMWNIQKTTLLKKIGEQDDRLTSIEVSIELTLKVIRGKLSITGQDILRLIAFLPSGIPDWLDSLPKIIGSFPDTNMQVLILKKSCLIYEADSKILKMLTPIGEYISKIFEITEDSENKIWQFYESFMGSLSGNPMHAEIQLQLHVANVFKALDLQLEKSSHINMLNQFYHHSQYFSSIVPLIEKQLKWSVKTDLNEQINMIFLKEYMLTFMGQYKEAESEIEKVQQLTRMLTVTNQSSKLQYQADCYRRLGYIFYYQNHYDESKSMLRRAKEMFESIGNTFGVAQCLRMLGEIACLQSDYNNAKSMLEKAQQLFVKIGEEQGAAHSLRGLGDIYIMFDQYDRAREMLEKAKEQFERAGTKIGVAQCLQRLGNIFRSQEQYAKAKLLLEEAKGQFESAGEKLGAAECLRSLGNICYMQDQYDEARIMLRQAKEQFEDIENRRGVAQCSQLLGDTCRTCGQYQEAKLLLHEAKGCFEDIGDKHGAAQCLQSLGENSRMLHQYEEAKAMLHQAKEQFERLGSRVGAAQCLQHLGNINGSLGEYEDAKIMLQQAKEQFEGSETGWELLSAYNTWETSVEFWANMGKQRSCWSKLRSNLRDLKTGH
ncbi:hypothetical protein D9758_014199 [Tetrapyrgos nigripes]|uniref:TPR-like protein n=1 Tax=Tetrapyrgos nigripes TaxID=182062 RepID=A0A8H5CVQ8_9AGAR|nr:hypothetical protein D9758_014199 [Tetrapyrgos nigripes]